MKEAKADYTPIFMHQIGPLFSSRELELDVALTQVSPLDQHGFVSLGIGVDVSRLAAESARHVIAQVNRHMPRTLGNSFLHVRAIHAFVEHDEPLSEFLYPEPDEVGGRVA